MTLPTTAFRLFPFTALKRLWQSLDAGGSDDDVGVSLYGLQNEAAHQKQLDLEERFDRMLAHHGLEYLIDTNGMPGYLRLVPLLEKMQADIEELRNVEIWQDKALTEYNEALDDIALHDDSFKHIDK